MKTFIVIALLAVVALADTRSRFDEFVTKYDRHYTGMEYQRRLKIFETNLRKIDALNAQQGSEVFGITKFADLSDEEFASTHLMPGVSATELAKACLIGPDYAPKKQAVRDTPAAWDWRDTANVVLSVKDQASCGSCWAFSTVATIEGQNGLHGGAMAGVDLSPQYVVDCSKGCSSEVYMRKNTTVCNGGCNGGWPWTAFNDIATKAIGGVPAQSTYPYTGVTGNCKTTTGAVSTISSYTCFATQDMTKGIDETAMATDLYTYGPLSIALNANYFNLYKGGVMNLAACQGGVLNHAVLLVGYGTDATAGDYWIVKNSWGPSWGEQGYIRIARGKDMCGIAEAVSVANL